jgi:AraC-like DNA-binding protein
MTAPALELDAPARWRTVTRGPRPRLRGIATRYQDYYSAAGPLRDSHPATGGATLILTLGPGIGIVDAARPGGPAEYVDAFIAGLHDVPATTESPGESCGVQVDLTPIGAYMLLRAPMDRFTTRSVSLEDAFGGSGIDLLERLRDTPGAEARFAAVDAFIESRLDAAPPPAAGVVHAWHRLVQTQGRMPIQRLAADVGWSRKHLNARFKEQVGLPPKTLARVLRFREVIRLLDAGARAPLSHIALRAGYYDQAHFNRDFRQFAGCPPGAFIARRQAAAAPGAGERG